MVALWYNVVHYGALWYNVVEAYADTGHHSSPATPQHLLIASLTTPPHPSGLWHLCHSTEKLLKIIPVKRILVSETMQNSEKL